jgi:hypothetical protein
MINKLEEFAGQRLDHTRQRAVLKEQQEQRLQIAYNGGLFVVSQELLTFVNVCENGVVILDSYSIPIKIDDVDDFLLSEFFH